MQSACYKNVLRTHTHTQYIHHLHHVMNLALTSASLMRFSVLSMSLYRYRPYSAVWDCSVYKSGFIPPGPSMCPVGPMVHHHHMLSVRQLSDKTKQLGGHDICKTTTHKHLFLLLRGLDGNDCLTVSFRKRLF